MSDRALTVSIFLGLAINVAGLFVLAAAATSANNELLTLRTEAIELGYAQHNPTTGEWEWTEPEAAR